MARKKSLEPLGKTVSVEWGRIVPRLKTIQDRVTGNKVVVRSSKVRVTNWMVDKETNFFLEWGLL